MMIGVRRLAPLIMIALLSVTGMAVGCRATSAEAHASEPLGRVAIRWLAETVQALEPALPRTLSVASLGLDPADPLVDALRYLRERRLMPASFELDAFDAAAWQALLDGLLAAYGLPGIELGPLRSHDDLRDDLDAVVDRILGVMRPVALLAWEPGDEASLAFVGVMSNWSPYPRLLVWPTPAGWSMRDGARELAGRIHFCGRPVRDYVSASAPVALSLFLTHADEAAMYLVGSEPETRAWPYRVERGDEVAVFAFEHPEVRELEAFSAVFVGDPVGPLQLALLLPQVRTNLSPMGLVRVLQTPPRRD